VEVIVNVGVGVSEGVLVGVKVNVHAAAVIVTAKDVIVATCSKDGPQAVASESMNNKVIIMTIFINRASMNIINNEYEYKR
jgi:hypothetical protein